MRYIGGRLDVKTRAVHAALDWMRRELVLKRIALGARDLTMHNGILLAQRVFNLVLRDAH